MTRTIDPRVVLKAHGLWARKRLGQNFLIDPMVPGRIAMAGGVTPGDAVFEIGAGTGVLTHALAARARRVLAIEFDRDLLPVLRAELGYADHVEVREGDIRQVSWPAIAEELGGPPLIYGNVPYNLSSNILIGLIEAPQSWRRACFLLQKEFARRAAAPPGTRHCGALSAMVALWCHASMAMDVPASAFHPAPKIDSAVLVLERRAEPAEDVGDLRVFRQVVRAVFAQRRKMARKALKPLTAESEAVLTDAGIEPTRRGETFNLGELAAISRALIAWRAAQASRPG